jgi:hypothetical protein
MNSKIEQLKEYAKIIKDISVFPEEVATSETEYLYLISFQAVSI